MNLQTLKQIINYSKISKLSDHQENDLMLIIKLYVKFTWIKVV